MYFRFPGRDRHTASTVRETGPFPRPPVAGHRRRRSVFVSCCVVCLSVPDRYGISPGFSPFFPVFPSSVGGTPADFRSIGKADEEEQG